MIGDCMIFFQSMAWPAYVLVAALSIAGCRPTSSDHVPDTSDTSDTIDWKGHRWIVTNGAMAGVAEASAHNVSVDASGYLHLKITENAGTWTGAELHTVDRMGFGTYQWQIEGSIDHLDKATVLGLFPYGPFDQIGEDGENELDIEFSQWNGTVATNADFAYYFPTGFATGDTSGGKVAADETLFDFDLAGGNLTTARTTWHATSVVGTVLSGLQSPTSTNGLVYTHNFTPPAPAMKIPQTAVPVGINFWCFQATPQQEQSVVIRDFRFLP